MVLVILGRERDKHAAIMKRLFELRYRCLVQRREWSIPSRDGLDVDEYDNEDAVYFLLLGEDGSTIEGAARVNHTATSSLLADLFPHLIESDDAPRGAHLYEGTRFVIEPTERSPQAIRRAKSEVLSALVAWCIEQGGTEFQAVIDAAMLPGFVEMSLHTRPLGLAHEYGGGPRVRGGGRCVAFRWDLTQSLLDDLRQYGRPAEPVETTGAIFH